MSPTITSRMKRWVLSAGIVAATALALLACSRERSRTIASDDAEAAAIEGPRDYREMLARARSKKEAAQVLSTLTEGIQRFRLAMSRLPTNLLEVVNRGYLKDLPEPPHGQAYDYDQQNGNVKLVDLPDASGIALPPESSAVAPVRLRDSGASGAAQ